MRVRLLLAGEPVTDWEDVDMGKISPRVRFWGPLLCDSYEAEWDDSRHVEHFNGRYQQIAGNTLDLSFEDPMLGWRWPKG